MTNTNTCKLNLRSTSSKLFTKGTTVKHRNNPIQKKHHNQIIIHFSFIFVIKRLLFESLLVLIYRQISFQQRLLNLMFDTTEENLKSEVNSKEYQKQKRSRDQAKTETSSRDHAQAATSQRADFRSAGTTAINVIQEPINC